MPWKEDVLEAIQGSSSKDDMGHRLRAVLAQRVIPTISFRMNDFNRNFLRKIGKLEFIYKTESQISDRDLRRDIKKYDFIYKTDFEGDLLETAMFLDLDITKYIVEFFNLNGIKISGETYLTFAMKYAKSNVQYFLHIPSLVNQPNSKGELPIQLAIVQCSFNVVETLLSMGADYDENVIIRLIRMFPKRISKSLLDKLNFHLTYELISSKDSLFLEYLFNDLSLLEGIKFPHTSVDFFIAKELFDIAHKLYEQGIPITQFTDNTIKFAVKYGMIDLIKSTFESNPDLDAGDYVEYAYSASNQESLLLLLSLNKNPDRNFNISLATVLNISYLSNNINLSKFQIDDQSLQALNKIIVDNDFKRLQLLIDHNFDFNVILDAEENTFAFRCIRQYNFEMIRRILPYINIDYITTQEGNLLKLLIEVYQFPGAIDLINDLLDRDVNVNVTNARKPTPLVFAAGRDMLWLVKRLLDNGADMRRNYLYQGGRINVFTVANFECKLELLKRGYESRIVLLSIAHSERLNEKEKEELEILWIKLYPQRKNELYTIQRLSHLMMTNSVKVVELLRDSDLTLRNAAGQDALEYEMSKNLSSRNKVLALMEIGFRLLHYTNDNLINGAINFWNATLAERLTYPLELLKQICPIRKMDILMRQLQTANENWRKLPNELIELIREKL